MLREIWYRPTLAAVLENRTETLAIVGVGLVQINLHLLGLPGWACPFKQLFGVPCPGCGLTTAIGQIFRGRVDSSFHTHAFAFFFLAAFLLMGIVLLLPKKYSQALVAQVSRIETKTGLTAWFLNAFMLYWVVRLLGYA
jgi:hypothetical protein